MSFSDNFIAIMDKLSKEIGVSIDWTSKNVMPYVEDLMSRYINYEIATSIIWIVISLFAILIPIGIIAFLINKSGGTVELTEETAVFLGFIVLVIVVVFSMIIIFQTFDIVQAITIPEKTILEYIQFQLR